MTVSRRTVRRATLYLDPSELQSLVHGTFGGKPECHRSGNAILRDVLNGQKVLPTQRPESATVFPPLSYERGTPARSPISAKVGPRWVVDVVSEVRAPRGYELLKLHSNEHACGKALHPHCGPRPFHQKSTCLIQSNWGQVWCKNSHVTFKL